MARAWIPEAAMRGRLREELRWSENERRASLREIERLQRELCEARRDVTRATCESEKSSEKTADMEQELARLEKKVTDLVMATACARNTQLYQERQLVAAQEQLRRQEESFSALKDECLRLQSENAQLQSERTGCGQLMAQYGRAPTLVPADHPAELVTFYMTTLQQRDDELQQQIQLVRELEDALQNQKLELCLARSQTRVANKQLQSELETRSSDHQQHQQTVGDRGGSEALQPADDHKLLLEEEVAGLKARVAKYQQAFAYQQEALDLYAPLPAFMALPSSTQPSTVQADNWQRDGCAKCSGQHENHTVEELKKAIAGLQDAQACEIKRHQMEIEELQQIVQEQTAALAVAVGLPQQLIDLMQQHDVLKTQWCELDGRLKAAHDDAAEKQAKLSAVSSTVCKLEQDKLQLEEQGRCALRSNKLLQEQVADLQRQLLRSQCVVSELQQQRDQHDHQHQQAIQEFEQVLVEQTAALAAAAALQQQLTDSRQQLFECNGHLKAVCDELAQAKVELSSVSSTVVQLDQEKKQLQVQGHRALLNNQLLQEQVAGLHCQLLQLQYMVSDLQQQPTQQHLPVASEQALVTVRQQQLKPVRAVRDTSDPADAPSTPELGASSCAEARSGPSQPEIDGVSSSSSSSSSPCDANSSIATNRPASRGSKGVWAGLVLASAAAAAVVLRSVLSQRKAST